MAGSGLGLTLDDLTVTLRWVLMAWATLGAFIVPWAYKRAHDVNPVPWVYLTVVFALYALNVLLILAGSQLVLSGWWRPVFSVLNINVIAGTLWVLYRAVTRRPWVVGGDE